MTVSFRAIVFLYKYHKWNKLQYILKNLLEIGFSKPVKIFGGQVKAECLPHKMLLELEYDHIVVSV